MPKPRKGQTQGQWMQVCMPRLKKEGKTHDQAVGQCLGMWKQHKKKSTMNKRLQYFAVNVDFSKTRTDYLEGEEYYVAPVVMMTPGVHSGSQGSLLYLAKDLEVYSPAWNHKPIVLNHPETGIACTQSYLNKSKMGVLLGTRYERGKQRAEAWFHKKRTASVSPATFNALKKREMMEVSTGLFIDAKGEPGKHNGKKYQAVARNHRPDHLAILPDSIGACSIKDGAGLFQLNSRRSRKRARKFVEQIVNREFSRKRRKALAKTGNALPDGSFPIANVQDLKNAIHAFGRAKNKAAAKRHIMKRARALGRSDLIPSNWRGSTSNSKERTMKKKEFVDKLIANEMMGFEKKDRKWLMSLDNDQLRKLRPKAPKKEAVIFNSKEEFETTLRDRFEDFRAEELRKERKKLLKNKKLKTKKVNNNDPTEDDDEDGDDDENARTKAAKKVVNRKTRVKKLQDFLKNDVPAELRPILNQALQTAKKERAKYIKVIVSNENSPYTEEELKLKDNDELKKLAILAKNSSKDDDDELASFFGAEGPRTVKNAKKQEVDEDDDPLDLPVYNQEVFARTGGLKNFVLPSGKNEEDDDIDDEE